MSSSSSGSKIGIDRAHLSQAIFLAKFVIPEVGLAANDDLSSRFRFRTALGLQVGMVTTFGNGFWNVRYVGDPGRRIVSKGLRPLFHPECTLLWKGLYDIEKCAPEARTAFLKDVQRSFREF